MKNIPIRKIGNPESATAHAARFYIRDLTEVMAGNDLRQDLHRHDFYFLLALEKGRGKHTIDFIEYKVCDHSLFLMRPGQVHKLHLKAGCRGFLMEFHPEFYCPSENPALRHLHSAAREVNYNTDTRAYERINNTPNQIIKEFHEQQAGYRSAIRANLDILFILLIRLKQVRAGRSHNPYTQERLEEFLALVEAHMKEHVSAESYARRMHLSLYQLNTITRNTLGKTSSVLIDEHLLLEARRLLLATNAQINQVAVTLGYNDPSYFIRFFRKHLGCTPSEYRIKFA